jgi:hypothetical protein
VGERLRASTIAARRRPGPSAADFLPVDGVDRCECGCKYWDIDRCIDCGDRLL